MAEAARHTVNESESEGEEEDDAYGNDGSKVRRPAHEARPMRQECVHERD